MLALLHLNLPSNSVKIHSTSAKYRQQSADRCTQGYSKNPWRRGLEVSVWHVSSAPESKYIVSNCCVSAQKGNQVPSVKEGQQRDTS